MKKTDYQLDAHEHERTFVAAFIVQDKQERYSLFLSSSKRRHGFLDRLNHHLDFNPELATLVPPKEQTAEGIYNLLRLQGAPDLCHLISCYRNWDSKDMPLRDALEKVVGFNMGTVISCLPGRLAYYEAEDVGRRYILLR